MIRQFVFCKIKKTWITKQGTPRLKRAFLPENFNISDFDVFHSALPYIFSKLKAPNTRGVPWGAREEEDEESRLVAKGEVVWMKSKRRRIWSRLIGAITLQVRQLCVHERPKPFIDFSISFQPIYNQGIAVLLNNRHHQKTSSQAPSYASPSPKLWPADSLTDGGEV